MSLQKTKCDAELGYKIEEYLREKGVNTPTVLDSLLKKDEFKIKQFKFCEYFSFLRVCDLQLS